MPDEKTHAPQPASAAVDLRTSIDQDWALVRDLIQKSEDLEAAAAEAPTAAAAPPAQPSAPADPETEPKPAPAARRRLQVPSLKLLPLKRPSRRSVAISGLCIGLAALITWPGLMLGLVLLGLCTALAICAAMGPERLGPVILRLHQRLQARAPKRAEQFLHYLGVIAEVLPPRWRYGIDLPDVQAVQTTQKDIALERLSRMAAER